MAPEDAVDSDATANEGEQRGKPVNRGALYYLMIPLVIVASLLQSTAATRIEVGGVKPDLVLLLVVIGTLLYGGRSGIVWAFIGGISLGCLQWWPHGGI